MTPEKIEQMNIPKSSNAHVEFLNNIPRFPAQTVLAVVFFLVAIVGHGVYMKANMDKKQEILSYEIQKEHKDILDIKTKLEIYERKLEDMDKRLYIEIGSLQNSITRLETKTEHLERSLNGK